MLHPMTPEPRPAKVPAAHGTEGTSPPVSDGAGTQLSSAPGGKADVSSVAMHRGLLAMGGVAQPAPFESDPTLPNGGRSDAEIMLQVKAGDDSAFEYLVQKYRRPMVNFMYRMAPNAAGAEAPARGG